MSGKIGLAAWLRHTAAVLAAAGCAAAWAAPANDDAGSGTDEAAAGVTVCGEGHGRLDVSGVGRYKAQAEVVYMNFTVSELAKTAAEARKTADTKVAAFIKALETLKISREAIRADSIRINAEYRADKSGKRNLNGYRAWRQIGVRCEDFSLIGEITELAMKSGLNGIDGYSYSLKDPAAALREARKRAIADALDKASLLAEGFSVKLVRPCSLTYGGSSGGDMAPRFARANLMVVDEEAGPDPNASYTQDQITVEAQVMAEYAIE